MKNWSMAKITYMDFVVTRTIEEEFELRLEAWVGEGLRPKLHLPLTVDFGRQRGLRFVVRWRILRYLHPGTFAAWKYPHCADNEQPEKFIFLKDCSTK